MSSCINLESKHFVDALDKDAIKKRSKSSTLLNQTHQSMIKLKKAFKIALKLLIYINAPKALAQIQVPYFPLPIEFIYSAEINTYSL